MKLPKIKIVFPMQSVWCIVLLLDAMFLCFEVEEFYSGFHNVDLGQNMRYLSCAVNTGITDVGSDFITRTPEEMYVLGMNQMMEAFNRMALGAVVFGLALCELIELGERKGDKHAKKH